MKRTIKCVLSVSVIIAILASIALVSVVAAPSVERTVTLSASKSVDLQAGDTVVLDLKINNTLNLTTISYTLTYDASVFSINTGKNLNTEQPNYADEDWVDAVTAGAASKRFATFATNSTGPGVILTSMSRASGIAAAAQENDWSCGKYIFTVKDDAPAGAVAKFSFTAAVTMDDGDISGLGANFLFTPINVTVEGTTTIEDAYVVLTGADVEEGEEVAVSVEFGAIDNLRSGKLMVSYDPDLLTYDDYVVNPAIGGNLSFVVDDTVSGELYITFAFTDTTVDASSSFKVMDLIFITAEVDADESTSVVVSDAMFGNGTASYPVDNIQAANMSSALVGILNKVEEDYLLGDVTMDGEIDSNDAQWVLKWLLLSPAEQADDTNPDYLILKQRKAADMDKDGTITIDDVVAILKYEIAGMK